MYVFQLFDFYGASGMCLLWFCFFEAIVIGWIYGGDRFNENIEEMIGFKMHRWFVISWRFFTPVITLAIFVFSLIKYKAIKYNDVYEYPTWAIAFGWCLAFSSMIAVPIHVVYAFYTTPGTFKEKWITLTSPTPCPHQLARKSKEGQKKQEAP